MIQTPCPAVKRCTGYFAENVKKSSLWRGTIFIRILCSVRGLEGAVEQIRDLLRRGLAAQRHDDRRKQAAQEAGDDLAFLDGEFVENETHDFI